MAVDNERSLRIGLLSVYFGLFDAAMPAEFRQDRTASSEAMRERLERFGSVIYPGVVDSDDAGRKAARVFAEAQVDVIVFAPTMAAPPSYGWEAIRDLPQVPLVAVGAQELEEVPDNYATEEATRRSLPVGLVMFTNVLVREGRRFTTLISSVGADDLDTALAETLQAVDAAAMVRNSRLLAIGAPISGYLDVEVSPAELQGLGVEVIGIDAVGLSAVFDAVDCTAVETLVTDLRNEFDASAVDDPTLERSARLAIAMDQLCGQHGANAGAVNCHGDVLRWNDGVGITACLGVALCNPGRQAVRLHRGHPRGHCAGDRQETGGIGTLLRALPDGLPR